MAQDLLGGRIESVDIQDEIQRSYLDYAMSVIVGRAKPDSDTDIDVKLLNHRAEPILATKFFHSGNHVTYRIRTREGYELAGTANHPVLCLVSALGVPMLLWKLLSEMQPGDRVA